MTETWDDINEQVTADWKDDTTPFERVCEIVEQTHNGQSAAAIADRALVSEPTARRHCKTLVKHELWRDRTRRPNNAVQAQQRPGVDVPNPRVA